MPVVSERIARFLTATSQCMVWLRFIVTLVIVAALFLIIPRTPLDGPAGGVIALSLTLVCCWFGGPYPAAFVPLLIFAISRETKDTPLFSVPTMRETITFLTLTVLTTAVGLAGQYQRRWRYVSQQHQLRMREHARALSAAQIVFCDLNDRVMDWSAGAERLFGWTALEATGRVLHELLATSLPIPFEEIAAEVVQRDQWHGEVRHTHKDGRDLIVSTHWILSRDEEGRPKGLAQVQNDITALRAAEAAARESDRRKDLFLAMLAHELRNPLAPLRSGVELLSLTDLTPKQRHVCLMMEQQIKQLVRLVDDLLSISRINTGKIELRTENVSVVQIITDAVDAARSRIDAAEHRLHLAISPEPLFVDADPVRMIQAISNLLLNAAKFTPPKGDITVDVQRDGNTAVIRVIDSGIGIPADFLPKVFDPFTQSEDLYVRCHDGLGIGLTIVQAFVKLHGGTIEARSAGLNLGSEFLMRLPLAESPIKPSAAGSDLKSEPEALKRRVLVVDDNQDAARTLAVLLKSAGCDARPVFDGPSALASAVEFQPDAFILDLGMPDMSGLELAKRLRAIPPFGESLLIAVTGWGKNEDRWQSSAVGFDHHLVKPVDFDQLRRLIQSSATATHRDGLHTGNGTAN